MGRGEVKGPGSEASDAADPAKAYYATGVYGWRKRCLYGCVLLLLVLIIVNLALTAWIMKTVDFHVGGLGRLRVSDAGVIVDGDAEFSGPVHAAGVRSRDDDALRVDSARNVTVSARDGAGRVTTRLVVGDRMAQLFCQHFEVRGGSGDDRPYFYVNEHEMYIGPRRLRVAGLQGSAFADAVQTPLVSAGDGDELRCEAPMGHVSLEAPAGVNVHSASGNVDVSAAGDIRLKGRKVTLDANDVELTGLPAATRSGGGRSGDDVFQVCVCQSGRLFLAAPNVNCRASRDICQ
ncbi:PREDICTED: delta-sarcoglycan-like [Priapulus caudatus]|uniref:Delta-sarcoglycan-like n=1 Tax=Priapulus caudatus TaxID=37621 RepID=A0ABM1ECF6_PRICU|nr:PREDICTED: delta-sarcoglycan-like [Priapulus caudatus]XP_014669878.1 PREDICTED: delta-sarcoglycan-like [Priapulus caudatus]